MKKVLGIACSIALICVVMGCGKTEEAAKTPAPKTPAEGTSQLDNKDPKGSADSEPAPKGNTEPGATEPGVTEPGATEPGATEPGAAEPGNTEAPAPEKAEKANE